MPGSQRDCEVWLEMVAPHAPVSQYRNNVGEDNADAHMKRHVMGREVVGGDVFEFNFATLSPDLILIAERLP